MPLAWIVKWLAMGSRVCPPWLLLQRPQYPFFDITSQGRFRIQPSLCG
jgi:hypothetical protein